MHVDPCTRQTFEKATPIPRENFFENFPAHNPDTDQYYVLTPKLLKRTLLI